MMAHERRVYRWPILYKQMCYTEGFNLSKYYRILSAVCDRSVFILHTGYHQLARLAASQKASFKRSKYQ